MVSAGFHYAVRGGIYALNSSVITIKISGWFLNWICHMFAENRKESWYSSKCKLCLEIVGWCTLFKWVLTWCTNMIYHVLGERAKEKEKDKHSSTSSVSSKSSISSAGTINGVSTIQNGKAEPTWVHEIFEGILTNETRCLCCETVCTISFCLAKF